MEIVSRETICLCGGWIAPLVFEKLDPTIQVDVIKKDGDIVTKGQSVISLYGSAKSLLAGERVLLNLMQRMSGVATLTKRYVDAIAHTKAKLLDTRKTMPGLRILDKYAVLVGGGLNHRMRLDDMVLIKDNHIALSGGVAEAMQKVRSGLSQEIPVVIECDTLEQVQEALKHKPDRILLDNMNIEELKIAVAMSDGSVALEASGGVNLDTIAAIAETGVNYISVGSITHSAPAVDIGADIIVQF
jgi:nicotinate-nucleotide pyrophosphorylase (carboxylating)